jgi:thiol-disulfide isomerase/thioredoxin
MKRSLGTEEWVRRGLGVAVLVGVVAIASGWDTGVLRRISLEGTSGIEQRLVDRVQPVRLASTGDSSVAQRVQAANEGSLPSLEGAVAWLNSPPLTREGLKGNVVLIDFWTYSCINCLRAIPYVEAWANKYKDQGLVVIGVHTPEFAFERDQNNVANAVRTLGLTYPVAIDNTYAIWKLFHNMYWPAHYFVDAHGTIRYHHFGEGEYDTSERVIQQLLNERNATQMEGGLVDVRSSGAQAPAALGEMRSPETYVGYGRQKHYVSPEPVKQNLPSRYTAPATLQLNDWALAGNWEIGRERALLVTAPGKVVFRFHARDLHLVLGPGKDGRPVRFRVLLDGKAPLADHGMDIDDQGNGTVKEYRLYQLIRQEGTIADHTFEIEFLDPGVEAFAFTFG